LKYASEFFGRADRQIKVSDGFFTVAHRAKGEAAAEHRNRILRFKPDGLA
jgi:hypothetical protein